jgi:hypothetical protein
MRNLMRAFRGFAWWQKLAVAVMVLLIVLTWSAVCLVLTGVIPP